jgi:hypothetical protein
MKSLMRMGKRPFNTNLREHSNAGIKARFVGPLVLTTGFSRVACPARGSSYFNGVSCEMGAASR